MSAINAALRPLVDALLYPFRGMPPIVGVAIFSLIVAVIGLLLVKLMSNAEKIETRKRARDAGLLEIRLFNDDLRRIWGGMGQIIRHQTAYVGLLFAPIFVLLILLWPVFSQLEFHWGYRGLDAGDSVLFKVVLQEGWEETLPADAGEGAARPELSLEVPQGLALDSPPVWSPSEREMAWRMSVEAGGDYEVIVVAGDQRIAKSVRATEVIQRLPPRRLENTFGNAAWEPAEPPLPDGSGLASVELQYPPREVSLLGWHTHWMVVLLILSLFFGFLLYKPMGVTL